MSLVYDIKILAILFLFFSYTELYNTYTAAYTVNDRQNNGFFKCLACTPFIVLLSAPYCIRFIIMWRYDTIYLILIRFFAKNVNPRKHVFIINLILKYVTIL